MAVDKETKRIRRMKRLILWRQISNVFRTLLPFLILDGILLGFLFANPQLIPVFWTGVGWGLRLVFAMVFMVVQFVAMFAFLSMTKEETILPGQHAKFTLKDYWGQPHLVSLVDQWIKLLRDPGEFLERGGEMIRGMLMFGPPGTGKTFLAKCMAGEAGVAFVSVDGTAFRAMFMAMDVIKMMRFIGKCKKLARQWGACIAYIDEIDALGGNRGGVMTQGQNGATDGVMMGGMGMGGGSGALTRLLYAMDGIETPTFYEKVQDWLFRMLHRPAPIRKKGWVFFVGATNRPDTLDPALMREGRFDIKIRVDPAARAGRAEQVAGYLKKIKHGEVDVEGLVDDTHGWTPAKIKTALQKHAVRISIRSGHAQVEQDDIDEALREAQIGIDNPVEMEASQKHAVAYHEASHAVALHHLIPDQRITRISIVRSSNGFLGHVAHVDTIEMYVQPLDRVVRSLRVSLASRAGEEVFLGKAYNSVGGDYRNALHVLEYLYDMGLFGPPVLGPKEKATAIRKYWLVLHEQNKALLREHADQVHKLAALVLERGAVPSQEVLACLASSVG